MHQCLEWVHVHLGRKINHLQTVFQFQHLAIKMCYVYLDSLGPLLVLGTHVDIVCFEMQDVHDQSTSQQAFQSH